MIVIGSKCTSQFKILLVQYVSICLLGQHVHKRKYYNKRCPQIGTTQAELKAVALILH